MAWAECPRRKADDLIEMGLAMQGRPWVILRTSMFTPSAGDTGVH